MQRKRGGRGTGVGMQRLRCALLVLAIASSACSKRNPDYCTAPQDCLPGYDCSANACVARADGSTARPDGSVSCPEATHECVPAVPADWLGPMRRVDTAKDSQLPACAVSDSSGFVAGAGFEATGACICECGTAETIVCTDALIEAVPGEAVGCSVAQCVGGCLSQPLVPDTCTAMIPGILNENHVRMTAGTVTGGTCLPASPARISPAAEFAEVVALCAIETTSGECGENLCAPVSAAEFTGQQCIYRSGTHECPVDTGYSEATTTYSSLDDNRSCGPCACELPPAGSSCGGTTNSCNIQGVSQQAGCVASDDWAVGATAFRYDPDPADVDCEPVVLNPALSGQVVGNGAVTVCCTPAS